MTTHYEVLGLSTGASQAEIRRAYLDLARRHHPDRAGGDAVRMRAVNDAWAALGSPAGRALYDLSLRPSPATPPAPPQGGAPRTDAEDLAADLDDDTPLGGRVVLPRWLSLLPVVAFALSVALFVMGLMFASATALALSMVVFALSCAMFLAAPFVALLTSRRAPR